MTETREYCRTLTRLQAIWPQKTERSRWCIRRRVSRHEKAKKFALAERCLQLIPDAPTSPPDAKFRLASVRLKLSKKSTAKPDRDADTCLKQFADLAKKEGFDLLAQLKKHTLLGADELLYLGFHLAEEPEPLHTKGREILTYVSKKWPKTKMAKDAKATELAARDYLELTTPVTVRR